MKEKNKKVDAENQDVAKEQTGEINADPAGETVDGKLDSSSEGQQQVVDIPAATSEKEESDSKYLRLMADFDNFRKRTVRERAELYQRANEDIIEEILPVLDHLDLALKSAAEHKIGVGVIDGFRLVAEQLLTALRKSGLAAFDVPEGTQFDPTQHEAVSHLPSESVAENAVITQVRRGYLLGERILRAAQVVVSSGRQIEHDQINITPEISSEGK